MQWNPGNGRRRALIPDSASLHPGYDLLCAFPAEARRAAGFELWQVQHGATPSDWKPMAAVGPGVYETRVHVLGEWRVIYVAKSSRSG